jgi:hypothetical protein
MTGAFVIVNTAVMLNTNCHPELDSGSDFLCYSVLEVPYEVTYGMTDVCHCEYRRLPEQ